MSGPSDTPEVPLKVPELQPEPEPVPQVAPPTREIKHAPPRGEEPERDLDTGESEEVGERPEIERTTVQTDGEDQASQFKHAPTRGEAPGRVLNAEGMDAELGSVAGDENLADIVRGFPPEVIEQFQKMAQDLHRTPKELAQNMLEANVPADQAAVLLQEIYPELKEPENRGELVGILAGVYSKPKREEGVEPAPEEELTPEEVESQAQAIQPRMQEFGNKLQEAMELPDKEQRDEAIEKLKRDFGGDFKDVSLKVLKKSLQYSTVGGGIFGLILIFLMVLHTPSK